MIVPTILMVDVDGQSLDRDVPPHPKVERVLVTCAGGLTDPPPHPKRMAVFDTPQTLRGPLRSTPDGAQ